jgi:transposase-like protein
MAKSVLSDLRFHSEEAAFEYVEAQLWPNGPVCPHCGAGGDKIGRLSGKTARIGLRKCYSCRKQFTVRVGTIFEDSHLPLRLWLQAIHLMCASKKGISTRQLPRGTLATGFALQ